MKEISVKELKQKIDNKEDIQLIDVREEYEKDIAEIGGTLIPMGEIMDHVNEIAKDKPVVVHCRTGKRSATVIMALERQHGFTNLYNLAGGIAAWSDEIDHSVAKY
jgi:rhodanese-related sulfurtransferase